ncbi:hypothetical protein APHAL10511_007585 [Amanita phalloides]|nr:hypothetical protein APHAL10511_007585 [Amanita phalloides]
MALASCTASLPERPLPLLLRPNEHIIISATAVAVYDSVHTQPIHPGQLHLSQSRLLFIHDHIPTSSFALDLALILQSDYHAGFFTSSPKISLRLSPAPRQIQDWLCPICASSNPLDFCFLCGTPRPTVDPALSCPACTFLNPPSASTCQICDSPLQLSHLIRLSFRKGGDKPFYAALKRTIQAKAWLATPSSSSASGITAILNNVHASAQGEQDHLRDALRDLDALSAKARHMVHLAADLNHKLSSLSAASEPEEASFIRSSLSQLGLQMPDAPVTLDMIKDERKWVDELARELTRLIPTLMKRRGVVALDEVWGGWNRARGVALIPPATFLQVVALLPLHTRTFASGLTVLHTPPYSHAAFASRLTSFLALVGSQTTTDIALEEGLSFSLVKEMVEAVEAEGHVVRDDASASLAGGAVAGAHVKWWANMLADYAWDA